MGDRQLRVGSHVGAPGVPQGQGRRGCRCLASPPDQGRVSLMMGHLCNIFRRIFKPTLPIIIAVASASKLERNLRLFDDNPPPSLHDLFFCNPAPPPYPLSPCRTLKKILKTPKKSKN